MNLIDLIGYIAAILTTLSFFPQAWKIHKTKQTKDLSLGMFLLFSIGISLWVVYGICTVTYPIIVANFATLLLAAYILVMKMKYK